MEQSTIIKGDENTSIKRINNQIYLVDKILLPAKSDKVYKFLIENELFALRLISTHFPLDEYLLNMYSDDFDWNNVSCNNNINWSQGLANKFSKQINWTNLLGSTKYLKDFIHQDKFNWRTISSNNKFDWDVEFIETYKDELDFKWLSWNPSLPWSFGLIEQFEDRWNWGGFISCLSNNIGLPWSEELIEKYESKWDWEYLSSNPSLPWSIELIEKYFNKWNWRSLSKNPNLPWSISLIEKFKEKLHWGNFGMSSNEGLNWSLHFLRMYKERWDEGGLSKNEGIIWNEMMIEEVRSWGYSKLNPFSNKNSPWSIDYILSNYDSIEFQKIYKYSSVWQNAFKSFLTYPKIIHLLNSIRTKKNYTPFKDRKQYDVLFDQFKSKSNYIYNYRSHGFKETEMETIIKYFKNKYEVYKIINSEKAINELLSNEKEISYFQNLIDGTSLDNIQLFIYEKVKLMINTNEKGSKYVLPLDHEIMNFLTMKLSLPKNLTGIANKNNEINSGKFVGWIKRKFAK